MVKKKSKTDHLFLFKVQDIVKNKHIESALAGKFVILERALIETDKHLVVKYVLRKLDSYSGFGETQQVHEFEIVKAPEEKKTKSKVAKGPGKRK